MKRRTNTSGNITSPNKVTRLLKRSSLNSLLIIMTVVYRAGVSLGCPMFPLFRSLFLFFFLSFFICFFSVSSIISIIAITHFHFLLAFCQILG